MIDETDRKLITLLRHDGRRSISDLAADLGLTRATVRARLEKLEKAGEILGMMLLTWVNLAYYQDLMAGLRKAIAEGRFDDHVADLKRGWAEGDGAAEEG